MKSSKNRFLEAGGLLVVAGLFVLPDFVSLAEGTNADDYLFALTFVALAAASASLAFAARAREQGRLESDEPIAGADDDEDPPIFRWPRNGYEAAYRISQILAILFITATVVVLAMN